MARREPPNVDGMITLKVDNISYTTTNEMLKEKFSVYGDVGDVYIPRKFQSQEPRGFAFVRFYEAKDAEDAQRSLDGTELDGRTISIQEAKEKRPENPRAYMRERDRGNDRGRDNYRGDDRYASRGGYSDRDRGYSDRDRDYRDRGYDSYRERDYGSSRGGDYPRSDRGRDYDYPNSGGRDRDYLPPASSSSYRDRSRSRSRGRY